MELYFTNSENITENEAIFDAFESRHVYKTMRKKIGDALYFTDGKGRLFQGKITEIRPNIKVQHKLVSHNNEPKVSLTVGVGFIRHARMDFIIEKGTELGVKKFYLVSSKNSQYYTSNTQRWEKISRQAIKQSLRFHLPEIIPLADFNSFIKRVQNITYKFLADQKAALTINEMTKRIDLEINDDIIFAIGPEGGFSQRELQVAKENEFIPVSLGNHRLRTETALLSVASYFNLFRN